MIFFRLWLFVSYFELISDQRQDLPRCHLLIFSRQTPEYPVTNTQEVRSMGEGERRAGGVQAAAYDQRYRLRAPRRRPGSTVPGTPWGGVPRGVPDHRQRHGRGRCPADRFHPSTAARGAAGPFRERRELSAPRGRQRRARPDAAAQAEPQGRPRRGRRRPGGHQPIRARNGRRGAGSSKPGCARRCPASPPARPRSSRSAISKGWATWRSPRCSAPPRPPSPSLLHRARHRLQKELGSLEGEMS